MDQSKQFHLSQDEAKIDSSGNAWMPLVRCRTESEYSVVRMLLDSEEIDYIIEFDYFSGDNPFLPHTSAFGGPLFRVPDDQLEQARDVLEQSESASEEIPDDLDMDAEDGEPEAPSGLFAILRRLLFRSK